MAGCARQHKTQMITVFTASHILTIVLDAAYFSTPRPHGSLLNMFGVLNTRFDLTLIEPLSVMHPDCF
jgi:hypothetical protein